MKKEYDNDLEDYKKKKAIYKASLTEEQKKDIRRLNGEIIATQEKRKLKSKLRELGKPRKPMSSYLLYAQSRQDTFQSNQLKVYQEKIRTDWVKLPESDRINFDKQAQDLMKKYREDMKAWELKMISMGNFHLVTQKPPKQRKARHVKTIQKWDFYLNL